MMNNDDTNTMGSNEPESGTENAGADQLREQMAPFLKQLLAKGFEAGVVAAAAYAAQSAAALGRKDRKLGRGLHEFSQNLMFGRQELIDAYLKQVK